MQGLGEGVAMPSMNNLVSRFVPLATKATAIGAIFLGFNCGMDGWSGNCWVCRYYACKIEFQLGPGPDLISNRTTWQTEASCV